MGPVCEQDHAARIVDERWKAGSRDRVVVCLLCVIDHCVHRAVHSMMIRQMDVGAVGGLWDLRLRWRGYWQRVCEDGRRDLGGC